VIEAIKNIFNVPDLRKRILFMLALLGVYRVGAHIPRLESIRRRLKTFFSRMRERYSASWT
jgi:preprotein translocase subunit SecY